MANLFVMIDRRKPLNNDLIPKVEWRAFAHAVIELIESNGADEAEAFLASPVPDKYGWLVSIADTEVNDLCTSVQQVAKAFGAQILILAEQ